MFLFFSCVFECAHYEYLQQLEFWRQFYVVMFVWTLAFRFNSYTSVCLFICNLFLFIVKFKWTHIHTWNANWFSVFFQGLLISVVIFFQIKNNFQWKWNKFDWNEISDILWQTDIEAKWHQTNHNGMIHPSDEIQVINTRIDRSRTNESIQKERRR